MKNIINFVGSSCTGKTSGYNLLKEDPIFQSFEVVESQSRRLLREGKISPSFNDINNQKLIFDEYLKIIHKFSSYISDRCLIDVLSFTQTFLSNELKEEDKSIICKEIRREDRLTKINSCNFGTIFYFPIYWNTEDDGERLLDEKRRSIWDNNIRSFLESNNIEFYTVPFVNPLERVNFIKEKILI